MKNELKWEPTKFVFNNDGRIVANTEYASETSVLAINKAGVLYQNYLNKYANGKLLDLGCGTVPLYKVYQDKVDQIVCIDWENSFHENIHLDYTADLNDEIPLEMNSMETVLLSDVLEHIANFNNLMSEISRVLKSGGYLILGIPFLYRLHEEPFDFNRFTKYQLKKICEDNGLNVIKIEEWGGPLSVILDIIGKNLPDEFFPKTFQKAAVWLINTKIGKKIDNRSKEKFPLGYCLVAKKEE